MKFRKIILLMLVLPCLFHGRDALGGRIYKWVDEKGIVHFSDRKPDELERVKGSIEERETKDASPARMERDSEINLPARNPIEYATNCTFTLKGSKALGTGFFISSKGYAITSRHVVEGSSALEVLLNDQSKLPVKVISRSQRYDLVLLLVLTPYQTPFLSLRDPGTLMPGNRLFAIGTSAGFQATITDGVFTGFKRIKSMEEEVIQFSAPINQGNSGGPLIDQNGKVVGVVSWKYLMSGGMPVSGVGFAIPSGYLFEEYGTFMR